MSDDSARPDSSSESERPDVVERPLGRLFGRALVKKLAVAAAVIGLCLGVVVTRAVWQGCAAQAEGDAALARGDRDEAITRWRRAARWYVPLAPHVEIGRASCRERV